MTSTAGTRTISNIGGVARLGRLRPGPVGLALTLYDVWRRLPPKQRKQLVTLARKHGPTAARRVLEFQRARRGGRPKR
jgi:hypothetical protein